MKKPPIHTDSARRLVAGIISNAVDDLKMLTARGYFVVRDGSLQMDLARIVGFEARNDRRMQKIKMFANYKYASEMKSLFHFFRPGGAMDDWVYLANLKVAPDAIRSKLGIPNQP